MAAAGSGAGNHVFVVRNNRCTAPAACQRFTSHTHEFVDFMDVAMDDRGDGRAD